MGRRVAVQTRGRAGHQIRYLFLGVTAGIQELLRLPMRRETAQVGVRPGNLDRKDVRARRIAPDVAESLDFRPERTGQAVVGVARVALVLLDVAVLEMGRGERVALHI